MWHNFQKYIPRAAGKYNFTQTLKAIEVCNACRELIEQHLPKEAAEKVTPRSYKDQVLTIGVPNSAWANRVQMVSHRIHRGLKDKFGEQSVGRIRITHLPQDDIST